MSDTSVTTSTMLFNHLFEACNILRGPINQDEYKTYVIPILFFKRISDTYDEETAQAIEEYGEDVISLYAGCFADELIVRNSEDVIKKIKRFKEDVSFRNKVINYLRTYLSFMDVRSFTRNVYNVISDGDK